MAGRFFRLGTQTASAVLLALLAASAAGAAACLPAPAERVEAVRALAGDSFELADGRQVRLPGLVAPRAPLIAETPWPDADAARQALQALVAGKRIGLRPSARRTDRYGRLLAHAALEGSDDALSLETALLAAGHARVAPAEVAPGCIAALLAAEARARAEKLGLWSNPYYAVRPARDRSDLTDLAGAYLLAEGRVASVRAVGSRIYLNFARRWRDGLSVTIWKGYAARFAGGEEGLRRLEGEAVRVRGWLSADGALIPVLGPGQIERLQDPEPGRRE